MPRDTSLDRPTPLAATALGARLRLVAWIGAATLLLLPAFAMRLTAEVDWGAGDFVVFGGMLAAACGALELLLRRPADPRYFAGYLLALATGFALLWANLAVGLIGSEADPANAMYAGVLGIALGGALLSRLRPRGMAIAMLATAIAQWLVPAVAGALGQWPVLAVTAGFGALWLGAAGLFALAARRADPRRGVARH